MKQRDKLTNIHEANFVGTEAKNTMAQMKSKIATIGFMTFISINQAIGIGPRSG